MATSTSMINYAAQGIVEDVWLKIILSIATLNLTGGIRLILEDT